MMWCTGELHHNIEYTQAYVTETEAAAVRLPNIELTVAHGTHLLHSLYFQILNLQ
jgi:hypothetical protein